MKFTLEVDSDTYKRYVETTLGLYSIAWFYYDNRQIGVGPGRIGVNPGWIAYRSSMRLSQGPRFATLEDAIAACKQYAIAA